MSAVEGNKLAEQVEDILKDVFSKDEGKISSALEKLFKIYDSSPPQQARKITKITSSLPRRIRSTILHSAAKNGHAQVLKLLLEEGEKAGEGVNEKQLLAYDAYVLRGAAKNDHAQVVKLLEEALTREVKKNGNVLDGIPDPYASGVESNLVRDLSRKTTQAHSDLEEEWGKRESGGRMDKKELKKAFKSDPVTYRLFMGRHANLGSAVALRKMASKAK